MNTTFKVSALLVGMLFAGMANAQDELVLDALAAKKIVIVKPKVSVVATPPSWMSGDVGAAWNAGYKGQGTTITTVDDFTSTSKFYGNLNGNVLLQRHGEWTRLESAMVAPSANIQSVDFNNYTARLPLNSLGLNVVNASYGLMAPTGYSVSQINFGTLQNDIIGAARYGRAVISKAAGNSAVAVDGVYNGATDYLNLALKGGASTIYVGALDANGTTTAKTKMASYSNYAGNDPWIQSHFLSVGVEGNKTGMYGTSFAAPIISGYSAILGSKFKKATPTQIVNQLLNTARTDTIADYSAAKYGKGEASLSRALAPVAIQ